MGKGSTGSRSESKAGGGAVGGLGEKPVQRLIQELLWEQVTEFLGRAKSARRSDSDWTPATGMDTPDPGG